MARELPAADASELAQLRDERRRLEAQVDLQATELNLLRARFARYETALRGSHVVVYTQDKDLRYTSISQDMLGPASLVFGFTPILASLAPILISLGAGFLMLRKR